MPDSSLMLRSWGKLSLACWIRVEEVFWRLGLSWKLK